MATDQQDVIVTETLPRLFGVQAQIELELPLPVCQVIAPGGGVEHDLLAVRQPDACPDLLGPCREVGCVEVVVAGIAGLDDLARIPHGALEDRGAEPVGGHQHVPAAGLLLELGVVLRIELRRVDVQADLLQHGAVPGLDDDLPRPALDPVGEMGVGHDVPAAGQRVVPLGSPEADLLGGGRQVHLSVPDQPQVLDIRVAPEQFLVDGARAVGVLLAVVADVEHGVAQRLLPAGLVDLAVQLVLPVAAAFEDGQVGGALQLGEVVPAGFEVVLPARVFAGDREGGHGEPVDDEGDVRAAVPGSQVEVPPAALQRAGAVGARHGRGGEPGDERAVREDLQRHGLLVEEVTGPDDEGGVAQIGRRGAVDGVLAFGHPHRGHPGLDRASGELQIAVASRDQRELVPVGGLGEGGGEPDLAVGEPVTDHGAEAAFRPVGGGGHELGAPVAPRGQGRIGPLRGGSLVGHVLVLGQQRHILERHQDPEGGAAVRTGLQDGGVGDDLPALAVGDLQAHRLVRCQRYADLALDLHIPVHGTVIGDQGAYPLDTQLQGTRGGVGEQPEVLVQPLVGRVVGRTRSARVHGTLADQSGGGDAQADVPGALHPLAALAELRGVEQQLPARPVVVVLLTGGQRGALRAVDVVQGQHRTPSRSVLLERQHFDGAVLRRLVDPVDPGVAGQTQLAVLPASRLERGTRREVGVDPSRSFGYQAGTVVQCGEARVLPEPSLDLDRVAAPLGVDQLDQFGHGVLAHQQPFDPLGGGQFHDHLRIHLVEELVDDAQELGAELLVPVGKHVEEDPQIALEDGAVVLALQRRGLLAGLTAEEAAHRLHRGRSVAYGLRLGPALGDGRGALALAQPPVVRGRADDVDGLGQELGGHDDRHVLVEHPFGEGQPVLLPERAPEDLVAGDLVVEQLPVHGHMGPLDGAAGEDAVHRGLPHLGPVDVQHVARDEVRAALVQARQHEAVGVRRNHVVAVDEREELALGCEQPEPRVPCGTEAGVLLGDQPEPRVAGLVRGRDGGRIVGGPVIHHDDFEVLERLCGQRVQAGGQILLDAVDRHDDAETRGHSCGFLSGQTRSNSSSAWAGVGAVPRSASGTTGRRVFSPRKTLRTTRSEARPSSKSQ